MVRSGCVKEIDESARHRSVINFFLPGEMPGLLGASGFRSTTTNIAAEPTTVCVVPWAPFKLLCASSPCVARGFMRLLAGAASPERDVLTLIRDCDALERVAGFLLNLSYRLQAPGGLDFRLGMSRDDIASHLGLRSETVSRCFSKLQRRGLISVRTKQIRILELSGLRRECIAAPVGRATDRATVASLTHGARALQEN
jgi:CRP/FNR family transcriptional regulator